MKLISPDVLRQYLRFRGFSYGQLARLAGCSKSLIGHLATGERRRTSVDIARAICRELDVPVEALFLPELSTVMRDTAPTPTKKTA
ncbi:MAG: helix-turn-helix transcriptional regulator [Rhodobacterales bacterium]|nr:helix-turn-helix transcriptional regulator [Rhodobacterales bacterium]